jgi:hypothetical protein
MSERMIAAAITTLFGALTILVPNMRFDAQPLGGDWH